MALFAFWPDDGLDPRRRYAALRESAQIIPEHEVLTRIDTLACCWHLAAFATTTHYYPAQAQVWIDPAGAACVIHGLIWRTGTGALLDAPAVAALLDRPGLDLPDDVAGEYAVARLHRCGTLEAFGDAAGLHQLFHEQCGTILANRARFVASLAGLNEPDSESGLWLSAIGYRVGAASGWAGVCQLGQGARFTITSAGRQVSASLLALPERRGFLHAGEALLDAGLEEAKAALLLAARDGPLDLPITGGKDSRVVLGIALAAGCRDRLTLFTRGYAGHPDVVVGQMIAERLGVPHRREPPLGSDQPADLMPDRLLDLLRIIAFQGDGGMGGYDDVSGKALSRETLVSGHFGEVLKGYAKRLPDGPLDPIGMVRLQAPFDPLELLRPAARQLLSDRLAAQMAEARLAGAEEDDLPDLFYWRNRVPNWLGGIRGIKSFERQPILPLGVPALRRLAFTMTAAERKREQAHFELIRRTAPELLGLPFAHQGWDPELGVEPVNAVVAAAGSPLFGSWQWSLNRIPAVRAALAALFAAIDIPLWEDVDRARLIEVLHRRRFTAFDLIGLLGLSVAAIHQAGLGLSARMKQDGLQLPPDAPSLPVEPLSQPRLVGHLDGVEGAARIEGDVLITTGNGPITFNGWLQAPDWPGAAVAIEARADGCSAAIATADIHRPDLEQAGIGDGRHAFRLTIEAAALDGATSLTLAAPEREEGPRGGRLAIRTQAQGPAGSTPA